MGESNGALQRTRSAIRNSNAELSLLEEYYTSICIVSGSHFNGGSTRTFVLPSSLLGPSVAISTAE